MNKPVVAAIANYNMASELQNLLPQVLGQGYDQVFVLDDASTDASREVVAAHGSEVTFVLGAENVGAGGNRNRILPALGHEAIIHFLDADITLDTDDTAERVREVMPREPVGFVGGLALGKNTMQSIWNYGPRQSLRSDAGALLLAQIEPKLTSDPARAYKFFERHKKLLQDWPNPFMHPVRRQVFWNIEQNLAIDSTVFRDIGGFDESLREHEIQDLAIRMHARGLDRFFDPLLAVTHTEGQVRGYNRQLAQLRAEIRINRMHGLRNWIRPNGHFKAEL